MACEYYSRTVWANFTDLKTLEKAFKRLESEGINKGNFQVYGLEVATADRAALNRLRQAYQTEANKAALKKKGFFVSEQKTANGIKLTVRA